MPAYRDLTERIMEKVYPEPNCGCWLWTGQHTDTGYARISVKEGPGRFRPKRVSRVIYELFIGPIPVGLYVLHRCDMPCCVNPDHLFLGTQKDNISDMMRKGRHRSQRDPEAMREHGRTVIEKHGVYIRSCRGRRDD